MKRLLIILIACLSASIILADKAQQSIKQQQQRTNKEIKETARKIDINKQQTNKQLNLLNKLSLEISQNDEELNKLKLAIDSIDVAMVSLNDSIISLENNLSILRQNYAESLRSIRSARRSTNNIAFLFSSKTFADAYRRVRYLQQFKSWQNSKSDELKNAITTVDAAKNELVALHSTKSQTLNLVTSTQQTLLKNKEEQSQVIASLEKERAQLDAYMKQKRKEAQQLDAQLEELIKKQQEAERKRKAEAEKKRKEQERKKEKERKKDSQKPKDDNKDKASKKDKTQEPIIDTESQAQLTLSSNFEGNKGKLPYPVSGKCRIVSKFGRHKHPDLQYIEINNNGIDIELLSSNEARVIFDGTVSAIFQQPGYNSIVMVRHGSYITVYANLESLNVKPGDTVKALQSLGTVFSDPDNENRCILHFEVRKETQKLDPQAWIK